jgi:hypothetical protein
MPLYMCYLSTSIYCNVPIYVATACIKNKDATRLTAFAEHERKEIKV